MKPNAFIKNFSDLNDKEISSWKSFQANNPTLSSPYFTYGYLNAVNAVRDGVEVLCIQSENGTPIGFLPFRRSITGVARPADGLLSDLHGVIADKDAFFDLSEVLEDAGLFGYVFTSVPFHHVNLKCHGQLGDGNPVVDLSNGFEAYVDEREAISKNFKRNYKKARAVEEQNDIEIFHDQFDSSAFERLIEIKRARFITSGHFDVFSDPWPRKLLENLLDLPSDDVKGGFSFLTVNGEPGAMFYFMRTPSTLHYWFPGYEDRFSDLLIGHLMTFRIAEWAASIGIREVHMGPGMDNHKRMMGSYYAPIRQGYLATGPFHKFAGRLSDWTQARESDGIRRLPVKIIRKYERMVLTGSLRA